MQDFAADVFQEFVLLFGFDAFAERVDAEFFRHVDDGFEDDAGLRLRVEVAQESHVNLEEVELEVLEVVQRGVATAEVVHPELEPGIVEALDFVAQEFVVVIEGALGDLDVEVAFRDIVGAADGLDFFEHVAELEIDAREVDGDV